MTSMNMSSKADGTTSSERARDSFGSRPTRGSKIGPCGQWGLWGLIWARLGDAAHHRAILSAIPSSDGRCNIIREHGGRGAASCSPQAVCCLLVNCLNPLLTFSQVSDEDDGHVNDDAGESVEHGQCSHLALGHDAVLSRRKLGGCALLILRQPTRDAGGRAAMNIVKHPAQSPLPTIHHSPAHSPWPVLLSLTACSCTRGLCGEGGGQQGRW